MVRGTGYKSVQSILGIFRIKLSAYRWFSIYYYQHFLKHGFPKWSYKMEQWRVMKVHKNVFKIYKYIVMSELWKIWSHTMYIKNKERVFKCIPLYTMYCFWGNFSKYANQWKRISYEKNNLIQCMNIMNGGITKCMIIYDRIPGFPRSISFVRRHF